MNKHLPYFTFHSAFLQTKAFALIGFTCIFISLLFFSQHSNAIELADEEITVSADYMQLNVETGNSTFTGNVKISQGNLTLTGNKVILKRKRLKNGESEVDNMTITGEPARYSHVTDKGKTINAESKKMVYTSNIGKLVMTKDARLMQPENQVSSQKIVYDTFKKIVIAGAKKAPSKKSTAGNTEPDEVKPNQRVKITLTPRKKNK